MSEDTTLRPSSTTTPSSTSSQPSFVCDINIDTIASLAVDARSQNTSIPISCKVAPIPKIGAFNVVWFIDFSDGMQWVLRTPIIGWCPALEKRLSSDIFAMQLIQSKTTIPIPFIHKFCSIPDNPFGRPYTLMDRVKGTQLCKLWFDPTWFNEETRRTVFNSLASFMSQLRHLEFPLIGSLDYDQATQTHFVGPLLPSFDDISEGHILSKGPYQTVHAYLLQQIAEQAASAPSQDHKVSLALLRMFAGSLPDETLDGPPFVLSMPDFNYQNIFVDESGNVTGLIDWDGVTVGPRQGGYASYPSWVTRDWDPLMYAYPMKRPAVQKVNDVSDTSSTTDTDTSSTTDIDTPSTTDADTPSTIGTDTLSTTDTDTLSTSTTETDTPSITDTIPAIPPREELQEDSPSTLQAFRDEYLEAYKLVDPIGSRYTIHSHVFEALAIAVNSVYCRGHILEKLTDYVFAVEAETYEWKLSCWRLEQGILKGDWLKQLC